MSKQKTMITNHNFFRDSVYLSVNWVPKLIQKFFQTMEQTFVQRCETKVNEDACKDSQKFKRPQ